MKEGNKPLKIEWDANQSLTTLDAVDLDFTAKDIQKCMKDSTTETVRKMHRKFASPIQNN